MDEEPVEMARESDFQNAKSYFLSSQNQQGINLYDHMCKLLTKVLIEKPENALDVFEDISKAIKKETFIAGFDTLKDKPEVLPQVKLAELQKPLFSPAEEETMLPPESEEEIMTPLPNLMEHAYFLEECGVGISREELFRVFLAIRQLVDTHPLQRVRFWGKVLGLEKNYYIVEVEFREGEDMHDEVAEHVDTVELTDSQTMEKDVNEDPLPKSEFKPPPVIPKEENGFGCNKYTYFVTNQPGELWVRLQPVTPAQITCARQIRKFFTGNLTHPVVSFPPFPGNESNYLRAQIARITASTQISPINFYMFDEEEEAEEEDAARDHYIENSEYEGVSARDLVDPSNANWVHHFQYILPQGRCTWFNPAQRNEEDFEDEEEEEEKEEPDEPEPEVGPALLTPLSEDNEIDGISPWTLKLSSSRVAQYAIALVRSNLWPGAYTFGQDKKFENVYIGNGLKYTVENYSPPPPALAMHEYSTGPEVTEVEDPSVEEEAAMKAAEQEAEAGEEEGGEEEEEEDDE